MAVAAMMLYPNSRAIVRMARLFQMDSDDFGMPLSSESASTQSPESSLITKFNFSRGGIRSLLDDFPVGRFEFKRRKSALIVTG